MNFNTFKQILNDKNTVMIENFIDSFISNMIYALGFKTFKVKIIYTLAASIMLSPLVYLSDFAKDFLMPEKQFFSTVVFLCLCDMVMGFLKSLKLKNFNPLLMLIGLATKLGVCYIVIQIFQAISSPQEFISSNDFRVYFILTWKLMIMVYPALSAFNNIYFITDKKFPPLWWMNRMHSFDGDGDVSKLLGKDKSENNEQNI